MFKRFGTIFRRDAPSPQVSSDLEKIHHLREKCECILFKARTVFPFDFFPDDLIIDTEKVNVIIRDFFGSEQIYTVPIKNITHLSVEHSAFFARLHILPGRVFQNQVLSIGHLKKSDAIKARNIIQGLVIADRENVNLDSIIHSTSGIQEIESLGKAG